MDELAAYGLIPRSSVKRARRQRRDEPSMGRDGTSLFLDAFLQRLNAAGYRAEFRGSELYVDGRRIGARVRSALIAAAIPPRELARGDVFARLVERRVPDLLLFQARDHVRAFDATLHVRRLAKGRDIEIVHANTAIARVSASAFNTGEGHHRKGPFWAPGAHWSEALALLARPSSSRPATPRTRGAQRATGHQPSRVQRRGGSRPATGSVTPGPRTINWPSDADGALTQRAATASVLLRDHRVRAEDFRLQLDAPDGQTLTFEPPRPSRTSTRFDLPFVFQSPAGSIEGAIHLSSPNTPLSIALLRRDAQVDLLHAWTLLLEAAADRYCEAPETREGIAESSAFQPDATTASFLTEHWVISHRVRLPPGQRAGDEAIKAAEAAGIDLPDGYTWRNGHRRGGSAIEPETVVLRFQWHPRKRAAG
jgi:hypothetical protein